MSEPTTHALDVPGAVLTYDVRRNQSGTEPVLLLFGSPMAAPGFGTLAGHFADRTVVTYDPRQASTSDLIAAVKKAEGPNSPYDAAVKPPVQ